MLPAQPLTPSPPWLPGMEGFAQGHGGPAAMAAAWRRAPSRPGPRSHPDRARGQGGFANAILLGRRRGDRGWAGGWSAAIALAGKGWGWPRPRSPRGMQWVSRVSVGRGRPAPLIHHHGIPPVGVYPGTGCHRRPPGQQMARRGGKGGPCRNHPGVNKDVIHLTS